jgi:hypothetical protein
MAFQQYPRKPGFRGMTPDVDIISNALEKAGF